MRIINVLHWRLWLGLALAGLPLTVVRIGLLESAPSALAVVWSLVAAVFPAAFFLILVTVLGNGPKERVALWCTVGMYSAVLLLHSIYLSARGGVPRLRQISQLPELASILPTLGPLVGPSAIFVTLAPFLGVALLNRSRDRTSKRGPTPLRSTQNRPTLPSHVVLGVLGLWLVVLLHGNWFAEQALQSRIGVSKAQLRIAEADQLAAKLGLSTHWRMELMETLRRGQGIDEDYPGTARKLLREVSATASPTPPQAGVVQRESTGPALDGGARNLLWIQVESLDPSAIEGYQGRIAMPFLSGLAREGTYFRNFWAQHSAGGTSDAELSSLTSLLPLATHAGIQTLDPTLIVPLPGYLRDNGFTTLAFHGYRPSFYSREQVLPRIGFDRFYGGTELTGMPERLPIEDRFAFQGAATILEATREPFFALIITVESHGPFAGASEYLDTMQRVDASIETFFVSLEERGVLANTAVFIYGDHLAGVVDQRMAGKERVPLIVWSEHAQDFDAVSPASHLDLAPTALEVLRIERPYGWLGDSLLGARVDDAVVLFNDLSVLRSKVGEVPLMTKDQRVLAAVHYSASVLDP